MNQPTVTHRESTPTGLPLMLYGTAWKENETQRLTLLALQQGFRGVDTANQRKHYYEEGVGKGIATAIEQGLVTRDELFLQTKFTFRDGQDHRLPYDPAAAIAVQVQQSMSSSLSHLNTTHVDSYVLHGPSQRVGLGHVDWEAWRAMEDLHADGRVRSLGISNVSLEQLQLLSQSARVPPRFVQNRCYAVRGWDHGVRNFCQANQIIYQGFSLLTANRDVLAETEMMRMAELYGRSVNQLVFRFAIQMGMLPLTGTTNPEHMRDDLEVVSFQLDDDELHRIERIGLS